MVSQASPAAHAAVTALMPQPRSIAYRDGWLQVAGGFRIGWSGYHDSMLDRAVLPFRDHVTRCTGQDLSESNAAQHRIDCQSEVTGYLTLDVRERYSLAIKMMVQC